MTNTGWFDGWQNARQRRAIEGLEGELDSLSSSLARQRRDSAALRSQLRHLHGTLEQRVERLSRSLAAVVELSDVRMVLAMFDQPARTRHWARDAVTAVLDADRPVTGLPEPPEDVPGYWLGPAVQALVALARGEDAAESLTAAEQRDPGRTAQLLCFTFLLAGRPELATRWLAPALGRLRPGVPVTVAQRALWTVLASGAAGSGGAAVLRQVLAGLVAELTPEQQQAEQSQWRSRVDGLAVGSVSSPEVLSTDPEARVAATRALSAVRQLAALRRLCCPEGSPPGAAGPAGLDPDHSQLLTEVVHALVDEGTAEEAPLLRQAVELRAAVEDAGGAAPPPSWHSDAGDPLVLLRTDAFAADRTQLGGFAREAGREWLLPAAADLARSAAITPPVAVTLSVCGQVIPVGPTGPDAFALSRARAVIEQQPVVDPTAGKLAAGIAGGGGALLVPVPFLPAALAVLAALAGVGLLLVAGVQWQREREHRRHRAVRRDAELARVENASAKTASQLADLHRRLQEAEKSAVADLAALRACLSG